MEKAFRRLEVQVPKPIETIARDSPALRYVEKSLYQAILLKLARYISGMNAGAVLLSAGYVQELAVIQRTLDEIQEDIIFLILEPPPVGEGRGLRAEYLKRFWEEEFDDGVAPMDSKKGRYPISRPKIREYIGRQMSNAFNAAGERASSVLYQTYSGFVHSAGPFLLELCEGPDETFLLRGLLGTHRIEEHSEDFWNQHYRGLVVFKASAKAFGDAALVDYLTTYMDHFEEVSNTTFMADVRARP